MESVVTAPERAAAMEALAGEAAGCRRCPQLVESRSQVVFGSGPADAELMLVGEAPGASEDREGLPFVGASGKLLDTLLEGIGLSRGRVFIANVLKCRPPENRNPRPEEVANCSPWLESQLEVVSPALVVSLGNFATRLLRGDAAGIGKVHGQVEEVSVGARLVRLYPVFHPAAALYRRPNLEVLEADFARIPELLALGPVEQPEPQAPAAPEAKDGDGVPEESPGRRDDGQMGLF